MTLRFNDGFNIQAGGSGGDTPVDAYTKEETNALLAGKADTSLDNLTAEGEAAINSVASDKDLANLSPVGENRLHALKGYEDAGELLTDAEGLADVKSYAHSTFDLSKFTAVGSPNITDGVASGFSGSNYIYASNLSISTSGAWQIQLRITIGSTLSPRIYWQSGASQSSQILLVLSSTAQSVSFRSANGDSTNKIDAPIAVDKTYDVICGYNGISYFIKIKEAAASTYTTYTGTFSTAVPTSLSQINFGYSSINPTWILDSGSIDLKQFSVTADGAETFSGNKTGIDTVKADNYTVVGTPTISDSGIASGFSLSNGIEIPNFLTGSNTWKIYTSFKLGQFGELPHDFQAIISTDADRQISLSISKTSDTNSNARLYLSSDGATFDIAGGNVGTNIYQIDKWYSICLEFTGTQYIVSYSEDNNNYVQDIVVASSTPVYQTSSKLEIGRNRYIVHNTRQEMLGSIDLNTFKIYANGSLVYQPCLKIPYTLSKTGSKVVDSVYRDRVSDMYEQFGYAPYYTLSDTDFTLPMGEVYGMIERKMPNVSAIIAITQTDYDNLSVKDPNTLYVIVGE